uniref:Endonuclease/exonuclease/phosphatase domain-containing protein n=1 Tax=Sphaeramia orbicularis TaxID=375764 RepID=A0A673ATC2_9TELE
MLAVFPGLFRFCSHFFNIYKISIWNFQSSNNMAKRKSVINSLKRNKIQIAYLQETHLNVEEHKKYCREWVGHIFFSSHSTSKRDLIIHLHKNLPFTATASFKDTEGRYVLVKEILHGENIILGNVYAPNIQDEAFYASLFSQLANMDSPNMIIGDDFNCALCSVMNRLPSQTSKSKNAKAVLNINKEFDLRDIWRHYSPTSKQYTFHSHPYHSASYIGHITLSDHAPVIMGMQLLRPNDRLFSWRMNTTLLTNDKFIKYLTDQTDLFLETNDKNRADPKIRKKEQAAKQVEIEKKKQLEEMFYTTKSDAAVIELKSTITPLYNMIKRKAEIDTLFTKQKFFELANKPNRLLVLLFLWILKRHLIELSGNIHYRSKVLEHPNFSSFVLKFKPFKSNEQLEMVQR